MAANSMQMAACGVSAALYVLNSCPIHSRYVRRGIGRREIFQVQQFFMENIKQVRTFQCTGLCKGVARGVLGCL